MFKHFIWTIVGGALLVPIWVIMLSGFFLRCSTTKSLIFWTVALGKVLTFINIFCDIFESLKRYNMESTTMKVVPFFHTGTVLMLSSNNTLHLLPVSFDSKGLNILKTSWYVAYNLFTFQWWQSQYQYHCFVYCSCYYCCYSVAIIYNFIIFTIYLYSAVKGIVIIYFAC